MSEIKVRLDNLTMLHLKIQQLEQNKPRPDNHYEIAESLLTEYNICKDKLIEAMITENIIKISPKIKTPITHDTGVKSKRAG